MVPASRLALTASRLVLTATLPLLACTACQAPVASLQTYVDRDQSQAMEAVCRMQEAAWNRGDIEGFMREGYLRSDELTFFSGGDVTTGFDKVLERYRKRYKADGNEMGRLTFSNLDTVLFGSGAGIVRGGWRLDFEKQAAIAGLFTLVMRRTTDGWRIVHDHTSLATPR